jgi:uncharacterized membrane protein (DUF485 family)
MPPVNETKAPESQKPLIAPPTPSQQSWGTIIALVIIVAMIVVGALYAWGKRISDQNALIEQAQSQTY